MGLSLEVGILPDLAEADEEGYQYYKEQFQLANKALSDAGAPKHIEPEEVEGIFNCDMAGYSPLHSLRRLGAYIALERPAPSPGTLDAYKDPLFEEYHQRFLSSECLKFQHLIMHSDAEGFYIPVEFERVINAEELLLAGGYLGSTQRLRAECLELEALLQEIDPPVKKGWFGRAQFQYDRERFAVHQLLEACEASIRMRAAIVIS
ncbi:MAG: hypothetical protein ABL893_16090 [Hyphomicrobium sp.]|nr:hypothetical protein [Hyphomicrobium sp.]